MLPQQLWCLKAGRGPDHQSLVMGMWRLFHGPIHSSSSSDCVLSLGHPWEPLKTSPWSSSVVLPSTVDSRSPSLSSPPLFDALRGCSALICGAPSRSALVAALSELALLLLWLALEADMLDCCVLTPVSVLFLFAAVTGSARPEPWKVCRILQPASGRGVGLWRGTLSSSVEASLSSFLKCLANRELKTGEGILRLLFVLACVFRGPEVVTERRVRMMEPFWAT